MKTRRNLIQLCLLGAVLVALPAAVKAQLTYTTNNGAITITGYSGNPTNLDIPSTINGYTVTYIAANAFNGRGGTLLSVTIPDSVTNIGDNAFNDCSHMTNISLGNGVITIGIGVFIQCFGLTNIIIPDSVITIGDDAFSGCLNLANITVGSGVTSIGAYAFDNCYSLTNFTIPNSVAYIGADAFYDCYGLTSLTIPNSVTNLGNNVFYNCTGLTNIVIGTGVTVVGLNPFTGCSQLAAATIGIPNVSSSLLSSANNLPSLKTITLLDSVTNIGAYAFTACANMTDISIGSGVISISTNAFLNVPKNSFTVASNNPAYSSLGGVLFDVSQSTLVQFPHGFGGTYLVPNGVVTIGINAFISCPLTNVIVPNSVTNIASNAFNGCIFLTRIYFLGNAPSLGSTVFLTDPFTRVYYLPGTTGWGASFGGRPTALWLPRTVTNDGSFGVQANGFGFNINWASGQTVVVLASTDLMNWLPVQTNTLTTGTSYFSDPQWTNYPGRFYRLRSP